MERFSTAAVGAAADLEVAWGRRTPRGAMLARTGSGEPAAQDGSRRRDWFWRARLIATRGRGRDRSVVQGIPCSTSYGMVDRLLHDALLDAIGTVSLHSQGGSRSSHKHKLTLVGPKRSLSACPPLDCGTPSFLPLLLNTDQTPTQRRVPVSPYVKCRGSFSTSHLNECNILHAFT